MSYLYSPNVLHHAEFYPTIMRTLYIYMSCMPFQDGNVFLCSSCICFWFIVFNATFSNISAISWRPVLVVEEAEVPGENHWPWASNW